MKGLLAGLPLESEYTGGGKDSGAEVLHAILSGAE